MRTRGTQRTARRSSPGQTDAEKRHENLSPVQHFFYGHAHVPAASDLRDGWKAVKAIAAAGGTLGRSARFCLEARMTATGAPAELMGEVMEWDERSETPAALLARTSSADHAATAVWIVYEALSVSMAKAKHDPGELEAVCTLAVDLGPAREVVDALTDLCREEAALRRRRVDMLSLRTVTGYRTDLL